ncbi:MAG: methionyl-tRNA formyltransferase [Acidimicrobiia bacterium]
MARPLRKAVIRAVFLGTPAAALPSLAALVEVAHVSLVVTRPDRPRGRSGRPQPSPVKQMALRLGLPVAQPHKAAELAGRLAEERPDVGVVVAYGQILPPDILALPAHGLLNVHFSELPRWRGAAPVERAILAGDPKTGVALMVMEQGLDTGPVIARATTPIFPDETAGDLTERLARMGAAVLQRSLAPYLAGELIPEQQDEAQATPAPKVTVDEAHIDPAAGAEAVLRAVRAFNPRPGAWGLVEGVRFKAWEARASAGERMRAGALEWRDGRLLLGTADRPVELTEVQPAGRSRMSGRSWALGRRGAAARLT